MGTTSTTSSSTSSTTAHPRQLRLPGQAAAPEGPVDMATMYVFHRAFRRDLDAFVAAVRATPLDDRSTWAALHERWGLFAEQLHVHHSHEDAFLWPALRERASASDLALLDAMEAEHSGIDPLLEACAAGFAAMAARPGDDERAALGVRLVAARADLDRHLAHEETDAMAMLQRLLSPADWQVVEKQMQADGSLRHVVRMVPWATYDLPDEVLDALLRSAGAPMRVVWRLTRRGFARREQAAFAHA